MTDPRKIALFGELLKESFPGDHVHDAEDFERDCWFYRVAVGSSSSQRHRVRVSAEFLDDNDEATIKTKFVTWRLADVIRGAGNRQVLIANGGPEVVGQKDRDPPMITTVSAVFGPSSASTSTAAN